MDPTQRCIAVGASAGGVETLREVVAGLAPDLPAPVFVVLHVAPFVSSSLPQILSRSGPLPAVHPEDGAKIEAGVIYVAPPDHHLLIDERRVTVKKGPRENRFRPSIDALFRSAAYVYGPRAIGVVLSGALDDGTSGLWSIKRLGGVAIVQQPSEARFESMPRSALDFVEVDHTVSSTAIGPLLSRLARERTGVAAEEEAATRKRLETEVQIAARNGAFQKGVLDLGELTPFTCPECHGALVRIAEGRMSRFRCHTGHAYTDNALLEGVMEETGGMLWQLIRSLEEGVMLLDHMAGHLRHAGDPERAAIFQKKARELEKRSQTFHADALAHESLSGDNLGQ